MAIRGRGHHRSVIIVVTIAVLASVGVIATAVARARDLHSSGAGVMSAGTTTARSLADGSRAAGSGSGRSTSSGSASSGSSSSSSTGSLQQTAVSVPVATVGVLRSVHIPGTTSHFAARDALVYLPPAALGPKPPTLPVLELLSGTPSRETSWVDLGGALGTLEAFAHAHAGRSPIVVMPDINGSLHGDSECIKVGAGNVEQYLTVDVPRYVEAHYRMAARTPWSVAGLSEGGTCSIMLALRHPTLYRSFVDLSGLSSPTVGDFVDPSLTIPALFAGSRTAYNLHDPLWLLRHRHYSTIAGWFEVGTSDVRPLQAQRTLAVLCRQAGVPVTAHEVPGSHGWAVWRAALAAALPWVWARR